MKIFFKYVIYLILITSIIGCNVAAPSDESNGSKQPPVNVLSPTGAPALAFVSVYETINQQGTIDFVDGSDMLIAELSKTDSMYDIIVAPISVGAKLIEIDQTDYRLSAVITWGNLYYVGSSEEDLTQTGELALFGQGAIPEKINDVVNIETNLTPVFYNSATLVQQQLLAGNASVGLLAEPLAIATIARAKQEGINLQIIKDLQMEYNDGSGYPQAAIFVKDNTMHSELFSTIESFLNDGYIGLQEYLEDIGVETLQLPSVDLVVSSIERQNLHYKKAEDCKEDISAFLQLFDITYNNDMLAR